MDLLKLYNMKYVNKSCDEKVIIDHLNLICSGNDIIKNMNRSTYLLNKNRKNENIIEKFVHETSLFHLSEYNKIFKTNYTMEEIFVEFWFKSEKTFGVHFDKDEQTHSNVLPFHTVLTYLTNNYDVPTIITSIEKNELVKKQGDICLIHPVQMTQTIFNGSKYLHGMYPINESNDNRNILTINFWLHQPQYISYFPYYTFNRIADLNSQECFDINNNLGNILYQYNEADIRDQINLYHIEISTELNSQFHEWYKNMISHLDTTFFFKDVIKKQKRKRIDYLKYVCTEG